MNCEKCSKLIGDDNCLILRNSAYHQGCMTQDIVDKAIEEHGCWTHGFCGRSSTQAQRNFYNKWLSIKKRCKNPKDTAYKYYGAKGIKHYWENFDDFRNDMWKSFQVHVAEYGLRQTTIDRIDNDGNYLKENCRWATYTEQNINRSNQKYVCLDSRSGKWRAYTSQRNGKRKQLGWFGSEQEALKAVSVSQAIRNQKDV